MSGTLTLPAHFLTAVAAHDRGARETGGWLVARRASPDHVVAATGPGTASDHAPTSVALERQGVDEAVAAAGLTLVGDWHTHPPNEHGTAASPEDRSAWRHELAKTPGLDTWHGVIVLRARGRTESMAAWATRRSGTCEPVALPPITEQTRTLAQSLTWGVARGPLLGPPASWEPDPIRRELARLECEIELEERFRLRELNERLARLGIRADLTPLRRAPAQPERHETAAALWAASAPAGVIRRPNSGRITGLR